MWDCLTEILTQSVTDVIVERECEVDQYPAGPLLDLKSSPSKWWDSYHHCYPVLVHLVKQVDILIPKNQALHILYLA